MVTLVTREIPKIRLITEKELTGLDMFKLNCNYAVSADEFILCKHGKEEIYVNKDLENAEDIEKIINKVMGKKYLTNAETLFDRFEKITDKKSVKILLDIWSEWRKEREQADIKEKSDIMLKRARRKRLNRSAKANRKLIKAVFDIGFGLYEEGTRCDFERGAEYAFMLGYYMALQKMEASTC